MLTTNERTGYSNTTCFSDEHMGLLIDKMYILKFTKNEQLYWEGDVSNSLYFILNGKAKLSKLNEDGKELTLYNYFKGDLFGEYVTTNDPFNSFTAQIITDSTIGVIQQEDLEELMRGHPGFATEFTMWLNINHRYTQMKLRDLLLYGKNGALAAILIRISNTYGINKNDKIVISKRFTNIELAKLIGATRETVSRLLTGFKQDGLIHYNYGKIEILNVNGLKEINQCENCPLEICRL